MASQGAPNRGRPWMATRIESSKRLPNPMKLTIQLVLLTLISSFLLSAYCDKFGQRTQNQINKKHWQADSKKPEYLLLEDFNHKTPNEGPLESDLGALEALRAIEQAARRELSYDLDQSHQQPQETIILEDGQIVRPEDASDVGLARLLSRRPIPVLSLSQQQQQPLDYPLAAEPSWPSHQYTIVGDDTENMANSGFSDNTLDSYGPKLAEILDDEQQQLINNLALLDSPQSGSFDDDNATYSNVKTPSYTPLVDQAVARAVTDRKQQRSNEPSISNLNESEARDETRSRSPISTTLLTDEDFAQREQPSSAGDEHHSTTLSYGTIVKGPQDSYIEQKSGANVGTDLYSMLSNMYGKITGYLPFMKRFSLYGDDSSKSETRVSAKPYRAVAVEEQSPAKHVVSELSVDNDKIALGKEDNKSTMDKQLPRVEETDQEEPARKQRKLSHKMVTKDEHMEPSESQMGRYTIDSAGNLDDVQFLEGTKGQQLAEQPLGLSSMRHSSFSLPESTLVGFDEPAERNYYASLSKKTITDQGYSSMEREPELEQAHKVAPILHMRHFKSGDRIYGPYLSTTGPQVSEAPLGFNQNKSNDLYFLVMVAAFCMMAMAVVLSAGLFAYRIQQNRAAAADTDYPTYGVVGPNNMSAKCAGGLAGHNFIGGSFFSRPNHAQPGSVTSGGSIKSIKTCGSGANEPPSSMGAHSDSGVMVSSTGVGVESMLGKRASSSIGQLAQQQANGAGNYLANQNAARMYHYQHQKQQMIISDHGSAGGRHTSASDLDSEDENDDGSYTVYECPGLASAHEMEIKNPLFNDDRSP